VVREVRRYQRKNRPLNTRHASDTNFVTGGDAAGCKAEKTKIGRKRKRQRTLTYKFIRLYRKRLKDVIHIPL